MTAAAHRRRRSRRAEAGQRGAEPRRGPAAGRVHQSRHVRQPPRPHPGASATSRPATAPRTPACSVIPTASPSLAWATTIRTPAATRTSATCRPNTPSGWSITRSRSTPASPPPGSTPCAPRRCETRSTPRATIPRAGTCRPGCARTTGPPPSPSAGASWPIGTAARTAPSASFPRPPPTCGAGRRLGAQRHRRTRPVHRCTRSHRLAGGELHALRHLHPARGHVSGIYLRLAEPFMKNAQGVLRPRDLCRQPRPRRTQHPGPPRRRDPLPRSRRRRANRPRPVPARHRVRPPAANDVDVAAQITSAAPSPFPGLRARRVKEVRWMYKARMASGRVRSRIQGRIRAGLRQPRPGLDRERHGLAARRWIEDAAGRLSLQTPAELLRSASAATGATCASPTSARTRCLPPAPATRSTPPGACRASSPVMPAGARWTTWATAPTRRPRRVRRPGTLATPEPGQPQARQGRIPCLPRLRWSAPGCTATCPRRSSASSPSASRSQKATPRTGLSSTPRWRRGTPERSATSSASARR